MSNEHRELLRSASENSNSSYVSPFKISNSPKSPNSARSPKDHFAKQCTGKGSPLKNGSAGRGSGLNNGGSRRRGTWGGLLDLDDNHDLYSEENEQSKAQFEEYKKKITILVDEYFDTDDVASTANELKELGKPNHNYYFVKKLVSKAMDRHDKEKEMAAVLLSSLYPKIIEPSQVYKGFAALVESTDDFIVDIPEVVDELALFIARAVFDDILPPSFLKEGVEYLSDDSRGLDVIVKADKTYLSAPLHAEVIERKWGGNGNKTVENVKGRINYLLKEFVTSSDKKEAFRCIKDLNVPFFHHEIIKRAIGMAMEKPEAENQLLDFLKTASEEGFINSSQISKGFSRVIENIDDLSLDIPNARFILQSLISKAASEGWLCTSSLKSLSKSPRKDSDTKVFKIKAEAIIHEYFLSGDIQEVNRCLEVEISSSLSELKAIFVKKLITLAMERKNREKEMASVLLSSLRLPPDDVASGFTMLMESADDTALDIPAADDDLAMFLARAVVDEVLAPSHLEEIGNQGSKILQMTKSLLNARLSGERILRCWGYGGNSTIEDVKDRIGKLLEEFDCGGDKREACRCIKELGMPFFHHEVVKKAIVAMMEKKKDDKFWELLLECFSIGLIPTSQMTKGFERVMESIDDLALDVPDAEEQFARYVSRAKAEGWLDSSFDFNKDTTSVPNGFSSRSGVAL